MGNLTYQRAFQYAGVLLYSVFTAFLVSFLMAMVMGVLLYPSISFENLNFHIPEFIIAAALFLGGMLAPWLVSFWFGTVERRVAITSYCFTALLAIVNVILIINSKEVEGFGNSWSTLILFAIYFGAIPVFILSHLFLYLSFRKQATKGM